MDEIVHASANFNMQTWWHLGNVIHHPKLITEYPNMYKLVDIGKGLMEKIISSTFHRPSGVF